MERSKRDGNTTNVRIGAADVELTTDDSRESENAVSELVVKRDCCPVHLQRLIDR
jgi:hypothetical protein